MRGSAYSVLGRSELDQLSEVHDADPVAHVLDDAEVVGDEQVAQPELLLQVGEQVQHLGLDRHVERRDGLVGDHQLRLQGQRPGDADALALAARELVGVAAQVLAAQAHELGQVGGLVHPLAAAGAALDLQAFGDQLADLHARVQRAVAGPGRSSAPRAGPA